MVERRVNAAHHLDKGKQMADKVLTIPNDSTLAVNVNDNLYIQVSSQCQWCYSDPTPCFSGGLLAAGQYEKTTGGAKYGPYLASAAGTVNFGSPTSPPCSTTGVTATGHTIIVSN
jgi:hypothetical protein